MNEITNPMEQAPVVSPLYLPQIYAILLANAEKYPDCLEPKLRAKWEIQFLAVCEVLGIKCYREQSGPFWSALDSSLALNSQIKVWDKIRQSPTLAKLYTDKTDRSRFDQAYIYPCSPIGMIEYEGRNGFRETEPTDFYAKIIRLNGVMAAIHVLARFLAIPYPTIQNVLRSPAEILRAAAGSDHQKTNYASPFNGKENGSKATYGLGMYTRALYPWIDSAYPSVKDNIPPEIIELIESTEFKSKMLLNPDGWRKQEAHPVLITRLSGIVKNHLADSDLSQKLKAELEQILGNVSSNSQANSGGKLKPTNLILTGPPGTGKTRLLSTIAMDLIKGQEVVPSLVKAYSARPRPAKTDHPNITKVQFHPSYSYEDFVEGLRPVTNHASSSSVRYCMVAGPLKAAAELARLYWEGPKSEPTVKDAIKIEAFIFTNSQNERRAIIPDEYKCYQFDQRDGQFAVLGADNKSLVPFCNSKDDLMPQVPLTIPEKSYQTIYWILKNKGEEGHFVLILDELNRGNPSRIFGELLSLVEPSRRMGESDPLSILLPGTKQELSLPPNLHILCAMNLADRSLSSLDQAFRRRFKFVHLAPNWKLIEDVAIFKSLTTIKADQEINRLVAQHFDSINQALREIGTPQDHFIGHSYAFDLLVRFYSGAVGNSIENAIADLWNNEIHPLLREIIPGRTEDFAAQFKIIPTKKPYLQPDDKFEEYLNDSDPYDFAWKKVS